MFGRFRGLRAGIVALLAAALIAGFATETTSLFGEFWSGMLIACGLVILLTVVLAASFGRDVSLLTATLLGLATGCFVGMVLILGSFMPFALKLGGRDLGDVGGDLAWGAALTWALIISGAGGAVLGAACGTAAWALHLGLGEKRPDREGDKREAGR